MPYVNIKVTREGTSPDRAGVTPEQKAALIKGAGTENGGNRPRLGRKP